MGARDQIGTVKEDEKVELTVSELVASLKSAFRNACFTRVEEILVSREEKLKREIKSKDREIKLLMENLQRSQKECREVKEERDGLMKKVKESVDGKEIIELKRKNCELECAKLKAETEADLCTDRFKGLEGKVLSLERDYEMLGGALGKNGEAVHVEIEKDRIVHVDLPLDTNAGKTKANEEVESRLHGVEQTGKFDSDERMLLETNPNPNLSGGSSHKKRTDNMKLVDIVEIIDSDDESDSPESAKDTVAKEHLQKTDPGQNATEKEPSVHNRTSASSLDVHDGRPTEIAKQDLEKVLTENEQVVLKKTPSSSVDVQDGRPIERGKRESVKNVAENEPAVLKKISASSMDVEDGRPSPTERGKRDLEKVFAESEQVVLKKTPASSVDVQDGRRIERGRRKSVKNVTENEPSVLKKTSASYMDVEDVCPSPTERGKRDSGNNVAEIQQAPLKKTSASSMDANDSRPIEGGTRDSGKTAENKPLMYKRTSASSVDVEDGCPTEGGKRLKIENPAPFASPPSRNLKTHYGDMTLNLSRRLSELEDDSSSSSSSDDSSSSYDYSFLNL